MINSSIGEKELVLLAHLRKNGRATLTDMSRETGIPVSTIFEKMKTVLGPCIAKHTSILNNSEVGFNSRATVIIKVDKEQKEELGLFLQKHQNVNSLYRINNGFDFLADVICRQMLELEELVEQLERKFKIKQREVYFVIEEVKQEGFLADPQTAAFLLGQQPAKAAKRAKGER